MFLFQAEGFYRSALPICSGKARQNRPHLSMYDFEQVIDVFESTIITADVNFGAASTWKPVVDELLRAAAPEDFDSLLAISSAEAVAGVIGAIAARKTADILRDEKRDTSFTKATTTGLFFGARRIVRGICVVLGIPRPLAVLISSYVGSFVSEETKFFLRKASEQASPTPENRDSARVKHTLGAREAVSDVSKWLIYDVTVSSLGANLPSDYLISSFFFFSFGCFASICAYFVKNAPVSNERIGNELWKVALEGGVLFLFYERFRDLFVALIPADLNKELWFEKEMEEIEEEILQSF